MFWQALRRLAGKPPMKTHIDCLSTQTVVRLPGKEGSIYMLTSVVKNDIMFLFCVNTAIKHDIQLLFCILANVIMYGILLLFDTQLYLSMTHCFYFIC